jgi:hypothetical protein
VSWHSLDLVISKVRAAIDDPATLRSGLSVCGQSCWSVRVNAARFVLMRKRRWFAVRVLLADVDQ